MENYAVESKLGKGNYGSVKLVRHKKNGQVYVCKQIDLKGRSPSQVNDAHNEVRTMSNIKHPNIIGFIEAFEEEEVLHIIMEYADGKDLERLLIDCIKKKERLSEEKALKIFIQIVLALRYLHKQHVLHRDLKAANVFLTSNGTVKLGDFGFSKQLTYTMALTTTICGTPYYFSPELCQKMPYNNKSDMWSLGVLLYEMMALRKPFEAKNLQELRRRVVTEHPAPLSDVPYSQDLLDLCYSLLRKNSSTRPNVDALLQTKILREHLAKMSEALNHTALDAHSKQSDIVGQHPLTPKGSHNDEPAPVKAPEASGAVGGKMKVKMTAADFAKIQKGEQPVPTPPSQPPTSSNTRRLHRTSLPDVRSQVSSHTPLEVVGELTNLVITEQHCKQMRQEVEEAMQETKVTDEEFTDETTSTSPSEAAKEESRLRGMLGDTKFDAAMKLVEEANACSEDAAAQEKYKQLADILGAQFYIVADMQRLSLQQ